ncbi:hypothetical protein SAMN02910456_00126 [Ruminococcaceae bacterium YRB3002]|nr:hypothetical protein SAMN02910456_00126 [Ruminococcaceae bacterium YRB3002]
MKTSVLAKIIVVTMVVVFAVAGCIPYSRKENDMTALFDRDRQVSSSEALFWQYSLTYDHSCHCYPPHYTMKARYTLFRSIVLSEYYIDMSLSDDGTELIPYDEAHVNGNVVSEIEAVI